MLTQRRKLLMYLRRTKFDLYAALISRLGLKDSYAPQVGSLGRPLACALLPCLGHPFHGSLSRVLFFGAMFLVCGQWASA